MDQGVLASIDNTVFDTKVDIVFVIDATGSMQPTIDAVKECALNFWETLKAELKEAKRIVDGLRIKVIAFRDFYCDGEEAYLESPFFTMPDDAQDFHDYVAGIEAKGGGDNPECALEAITLALRTDFETGGTKRRHIIVVFTDDEAHRFEDYEQLMEKAQKEGISEFAYPDNMPKSLIELYEEWESDIPANDLWKKDRRLVIFAPDAYPWNEIENEWGNAIRVNLETTKGGLDLNMDLVFKMLKYSLAE